MHHLIKITSITALGLVLAACGETEGLVSKAEPSATEPSAAKNTVTERVIPKTEESKTLSQPQNEIIETRSADSHTHGDATLAVVLDGFEVTVELETPLYNLLGFEHAAETEAQQAAVVKAEILLSRGAELFEFNPAAGCSAPFASRNVELDIEHGHAEHGRHDHHEAHEKDEHHDKDEHGDRGAEAEHKDLTLQYVYSCTTPDAVENITTKLFDHFENLSNLDLVYLGPNTQKQGELTAANPRMDLTR